MQCGPRDCYDVINFFSPHAKDKTAIFLLAIGKPLKRRPQ